jgi:heptosyltransferase II
MKGPQRILFVSLSNLGDAILTLPGLEYVLARFPDAEITVVAGPRSAEVFASVRGIKECVVYDKRAPLAKRLRLLRRLYSGSFDAVLDLRNGLFGALLPARYAIPRWVRLPRGCAHMRQRHLFLVRSAFGEGGGCAAPEASGRRSFVIPETERPAGEYVVFGCASRSSTKCWPAEKFVQAGRGIAGRYGVKIVLLGDPSEKAYNAAIARELKEAAVDLTGMTTLAQSAALVGKARAVVTNDSALMHLASYLDVPVVALFGPTDEMRYGPWSSRAATVTFDIACRPCGAAQCRIGSRDCLTKVSAQRVESALERVLTSPPGTVGGIRRILLARTDRLGDVILTTPAIEAVRRRYPDAFLACLVGPAGRAIVEGNPFVDEVIVLDKKGEHAGLRGMVRLVRQLRRRSFDAALVFHPEFRVHAALFFSGIARRIGYARKGGWFLSERVKHTKQLGEMHEVQYVLSLARRLDTGPQCPEPFVPVSDEAQEWAGNALAAAGIGEQDLLIGIHPGASCRSKVWPAERFAEVAQALSREYGCRTVIVAGRESREDAARVEDLLGASALNLAGRTDIGQLAAVCRRCRVFITTDSGPMHVAAGVGVPVVAVFGRNLRGISPRRWGPWGDYHVVLHKPGGCGYCLAHDCRRDFACLRDVSSREVLAAVRDILEKRYGYPLHQSV